jgi:hypothetical protein
MKNVCRTFKLLPVGLNNCRPMLICKQTIPSLFLRKNNILVKKVSLSMLGRLPEWYLLGIILCPEVIFQVFVVMVLPSIKKLENYVSL